MHWCMLCWSCGGVVVCWCGIAYLNFTFSCTFIIRSKKSELREQMNVFKKERVCCCMRVENVVLHCVVLCCVLCGV